MKMKGTDNNLKITFKRWATHSPIQRSTPTPQIDLDNSKQQKERDLIKAISKWLKDDDKRQEIFNSFYSD